MPRYHFHAADGSAYRDEDGEELPDLNAAKQAALEILTEMLPVKSRDFWDTKTFSVTVKDESGRMVTVLTTIATVDPVAKPDVPPETRA